MNDGVDPEALGRQGRFDASPAAIADLLGLDRTNVTARC